MAEQLDCVVVGAGVVGLAVARSMAQAGREVVVLEAEPEIGMHTSSRNSEVIHAGIYYDEHSLKARLCVTGKEMLYAYCEKRHIPYQRIGKLIVATSGGEKDRLLAVQQMAVRNGVDDLEFLDKVAIRDREPPVAAEAALFSPSTGIIDSHALMLSLQADIEAQSGTVLTHSKVTSVGATSGGFQIRLEGSDEYFACRTLVNSAGLFATDVASNMETKDPVPKTRFAKGHYFSYAGKSPFSHLVYPLPIDGGLGVHATNDMGGAARFGPDVQWIDEIDYGFDESRRDDFIESIRAYFPDLEISKLAPAYTGIRPKLTGPGEAPRDFLIQGEQEHGVSGLVNLLGIESPGLTACLAIGNYVAKIV
jgi:L-2-hydroxyglutarate oxidase LhgO